MPYFLILTIDIVQNKHTHIYVCIASVLKSAEVSTFQTNFNATRKYNLSAKYSM